MTKQINWQYKPGHSIALLQGQTVLAHYEFAPDQDPKPFVHPVRTSRGTTMTSYQPSDHVWHRGLWFAWKYINGVNYWEEDEDANGNLASEGTTVSEKGEVLSFDGDVAALLHTLRYVDPTGKTVLREVRQVKIVPPTQDGTFGLDFAHAFTVGDEDLEFSATPITDETPWGGYAGLGVRAARTLQDFKALASTRQSGAEANGARAKWVDLSGVADGGNGIAAGVTIFDHPENTRHPSPVYVFFDQSAFGYANFSPVRDEALNMSAGSKFNLGYRVQIHDDWADPDALDAQWDVYAQTQPFVFDQ